MDYTVYNTVEYSHVWHLRGLRVNAVPRNVYYVVQINLATRTNLVYDNEYK